MPEAPTPMRPSPKNRRLRPELEQLEARRPLSGGVARLLAARSLPARAPHQWAPVTGVTMERITNPTPVNTRMVPPFPQVQVQSLTPVPGGSYNVVFITVRNSTTQTFDASSGLAVKVTGQSAAHAYPILTGDQQWKPREVFVFYFLTKEYYPLRPRQSAGFEFNFVNPRVVAIPGPSGFFQRIKYNPDTFQNVLDTIILKGPGSRGRHLGLPDTSLWELIPTSLKIVPV